MTTRTHNDAPQSTALVWFRNDLRVADNPALHDALEHGSYVVAVYLVSAEQHRAHGEGTVKLGFVRQSLVRLREQLDRLGIPLWLEVAPTFAEAPDRLMSIARQCQAATVFFNAEYPFNEATRDRRVQLACNTAGVRCEVRHGDVIQAPGMVHKDDGNPYSVFTPFKRRWLALTSPGLLESLPVPPRQSQPRPRTITLPDPSAGFAALPETPSHPDWLAGESEARKRLEDFVGQAIERYQDDRDHPGKAGTSRLSPYLAVGAISVRTCYQLAARAPANPGTNSWQSELIWREFYRHVVALFPKVSRGQAFRERMDRLPWRHDPEALAAWQAGQTGFPLVDAGMRQLLETGFMHNRLRMITAMFLTKHLLIDWREGERHFMRHLRDADFASNNGGWQWSASTGTDAAPYFRIFNPRSQAAKFDPDGSFTRMFVPELLDADSAYPEPMVDHRQARERALQFFKSG